jgi:hypothetical protein
VRPLLHLVHFLWSLLCGHGVYISYRLTPSISGESQQQMT